MAPSAFSPPERSESRVTRLPAGWSSISMPGSSPSSSSTRMMPAAAAGEERRRHLLEVALDLAERLLEAPLDRLRELVAQRLELGERPLEILPLLASAPRAAPSPGRAPPPRAG